MLLKLVKNAFKMRLKYYGNIMMEWEFNIKMAWHIHVCSKNVLIVAQFNRIDRIRPLKTHLKHKV